MVKNDSLSCSNYEADIRLSSNIKIHNGSKNSSYLQTRHVHVFQTKVTTYMHIPSTQPSSVIYWFPSFIQRTHSSLQHRLQLSSTLVATFKKNFRQCYEFCAMYCTPILWPIYDNANFFKNPMNSLNIMHMTKYIDINNKTSFIYVISRNYYQVCNAV